MKSALVILDMLNDFVDGTLANPAAKLIIDPIASLAEAARAKDDWLVVYANDAHQLGDLEFAIFGEHAVAGSTGADVVAPLSPQQGDVVVPKRFYSAFTQTDLDATCVVNDIGRMVIVGQHTDCCCRHTSYDAYQRGIEVVAVSDATCVFEPMTAGAYDEVQARALGYLTSFYGAKVMGASSVG